MSEQSANLLSMVKLIDPAYAGISEQPIQAADGRTVGWHSIVNNRSGAAVGGGTSADRATARRIAIAEFIERGLFVQLTKSPVQTKAFAIDRIPTTSCFAAGFDRESTRFRSLCEGVERWAWSQWIDRGHQIPEVARPESLTPLAQTMLAAFSNVRFFQIPISLDAKIIDKPLICSVLLGLTKQGVFAGSRVTTASDDCWSHAAIEAWRNWNNFEITERNGFNPAIADWLDRRVMFFGRNQDEALRQIARATASDWPAPKIELSLGIEPYPGVHLWRTIIRGFMPWHEGPDDRFVY